MIGSRLARWSAALALIAGLLGMHGLVVVTAHPSGSAAATSTAAPVHPSASVPTTAMHEAPSAEPLRVLHFGAPTAGQHDAPHPDAQHMLHLCLAVLAALLLLVAFVGLVWSLCRRDGTARLPIGNGRREPPRRPPPTSVRLAQLCVMRN